jgi:hypothetical protein
VLYYCGSSSVGRASPFQGEGREFDPRLPLKDMVKQDIKKIKEELKEEEKEFYGDETPTGSSPAPDGESAEEIVEETIGEEPEEGVPFDLAEELNKEEKARR